MTRTNTQTRTPDQRTFSSPVALAFVRTVMARRGLSEAQARQSISTTSTDLSRRTTARRRRIAS
jgi:hypothetical protein